jgi:hypothetical protein
MKSTENFIARLPLFTLVATLIFFASIDVRAQANLEKAIDLHIEKIQDDASENKEARKIIYGDVNGDGIKDAVVQYILEGAGGGNSWGQSIAVFLKRKGVYKMTADETVGGKFFRSFDLLKVANREIIGATETCPDGDPQGMCENPEKKQVKYVLRNTKLLEL